MRVMRDENIDDGVYFRWKNRLKIYIDILKEKKFGLFLKRNKKL